MRLESTGASCGANGTEATPCPVIGNILPNSFALVVTDVWGVSAAAAIHQYTGRPDRTCRAWASDHNEAPASALITIQRGKEGFLILARIMRDDPPDWWINLMRLKACAEAYEERRGSTKL